MVKRLLQYKTKHVSDILQEIDILLGRFYDQSLLVGSLMTKACLKALSPMTLYSAKRVLAFHHTVSCFSYAPKG